jgi:hypothetical protein
VDKSQATRSFSVLKKTLRKRDVSSEFSFWNAGSDVEATPSFCLATNYSVYLKSEKVKNEEAEVSF